MATIKHYFFKVKTRDAADQTQLAIVVAEETKNIGSGSNLAKLLAFKDLRAADDKLVAEVLGKPDATRANATLFDVTQNNFEKVFVVLSDSLGQLDSVSVNGRDVTAQEILAHVSTMATKSKELSFGVKGAEPAKDIPVPAPNPKQTQKPAQNNPPQQPVNLLEHEGMTIRKSSDDFGGWYQQVLTKSEMIDYYDISGCYILRPPSFFVWEQIQRWFDAEIKKLGVENTYFPMFVSQRVLEKEKDHIEGFAPEVAWVTRAGTSDLEEPIAIRPTSETVMYPAYAKWIRSYRDLPLKLNQWNSVVRWEFKNPQPFLRTREFLWQEGHTAHLYQSGADKEVLDILDLYRRVYEELLAVPVIPGVKSEKEKFAGGLYTTTVEGFIPESGRGIQGGTSHCLGQNFSKMFGITVEDPSKAGAGADNKLHVWQNSWGLSTRTIGVMVMTHSDDKGLVLPPRVAHWKVIVIPTGINSQSSASERQTVYDKAVEVAKILTDSGVNAKADTREDKTPPYKYNDWEMRGVPLRLEIGPRDLAQNHVLSVRRDTGKKSPIGMDNLSKDVATLLEDIQSNLYNTARKDFDSRVKIIREWKDFVPTLNAKCICVIPWCEKEACEDAIKDQSAAESAAVQDDRAPSAGAKSLCMPFDQDRFGKLEADAKCTKCGEKASKWTLFGRSY